MARIPSWDSHLEAIPARRCAVKLKCIWDSGFSAQKWDRSWSAVQVKSWQVIVAYDDERNSLGLGGPDAGVSSLTWVHVPLLGRPGKLRLQPKGS